MDITISAQNEISISAHGENYNIESIDMMNYQKKTVRMKARREKR